MITLLEIRHHEMCCYGVEWVSIVLFSVFFNDGLDLIPVHQVIDVCFYKYSAVDLWFK